MSSADKITDQDAIRTWLPGTGRQAGSNLRETFFQDLDGRKLALLEQDNTTRGVTSRFLNLQSFDRED